MKNEIELLVEEIFWVKNGENTPSANASTPQEGNLGGKQSYEGNLGELNTTHLENQIDELVFQLYGLDEWEVAVILG
jgi:hypothetical protein